LFILDYIFLVKNRKYGTGWQKNPPSEAKCSGLFRLRNNKNNYNALGSCCKTPQAGALCATRKSIDGPIVSGLIF
jgi:hypothetical protein